MLVALLCWIGSGWTSVSAQLEDWWSQTDSLLLEMEMELLLPVELPVKPLRLRDNPYQTYQIAFRLRSEKMEVRACLYPASEAYPELEAPHLRAGRAATSIATNDQEAVISLFRLSDSYLWEHFGADWGVEYYLQPKPGFSNYEYCKLLALHRAGLGTALIFFLFNEPENPAIDDYASLIRFQK